MEGEGRNVKDKRQEGEGMKAGKVEGRKEGRKNVNEEEYKGKRGRIM